MITSINELLFYSDPLNPHHNIYGMDIGDIPGSKPKSLPKPKKDVFYSLYTDDLKVSTSAIAFHFILRGVGI